MNLRFEDGMDTISFQIIVITYKQELLIEATLRSIEQQTLKPASVLLFDDCSPDNTYEVAKEFARNSSLNIKVYRNETNLGIFGNVNKAIDMASGDIVCFVSGDDEIERDALANYHNYIIKNSVDITKPVWMICGIKEFDVDGNETEFRYEKYSGDNAFELILDRKVRSFEMGLSLPALRIGKIREDVGYQADNLKSWIVAKSSKVYFPPFVAYRYRLSGGVTSQSKMVTLMQSRLKCLLLFKKHSIFSILSFHEKLLFYSELYGTKWYISKNNYYRIARKILYSFYIIFRNTKQLFKRNEVQCCNPRI